MKKTVLITLCIIGAFSSYAQLDSSEYSRIMKRLNQLEVLKVVDDTVSSLETMSDSSKSILLADSSSLVKLDSSKSIDLKKVVADSSKKVVVSGPIITFDTSFYDLGSITQGDIIKKKFVFRNTGTSKLYVTQIIVDCGCTEPEWSQNAIQPGESGYIIATYDSKDDIGKVRKEMTVVHNAQGSGFSYVQIAGYVAAKL